MKKIIQSTFLLLMFLFFIAPISAQKISIDAEVGILSSGHSDYKMTDLDHRRTSSFTALNVNYHFNEKSTLSSGLQYLQSGHKYDFFHTDLTVKLGYIILPLSYKRSFGQSNRFYSSIGLYFGVNVKAEAVNTAPDPEGPIFGIAIPDGDRRSFVEDYLFGANVGIGYIVYSKGPFDINTNLKYFQGLSNTYTYQDDSNNNSFLFSVSAAYKL